MNERIKELAEQAWVYQMRVYETDGVRTFGEREQVFDKEKFAELIVRECVGIVAKRKNQAIDDGWNIDEAMSVAEMDLLEHFGVEE